MLSGAPRFSAQHSLGQTLAGSGVPPGQDVVKAGEGLFSTVACGTVNRTIDAIGESHVGSALRRRSMTPEPTSPRPMWSVRIWYLYLGAFGIQLVVGLRETPSDIEALGWLAAADEVWMKSSSLIITSAGLAFLLAELVDVAYLGARWAYRKCGRDWVMRLGWWGMIWLSRRLLRRDVIQEQLEDTLRTLQERDEPGRRRGDGSGT